MEIQVSIGSVDNESYFLQGTRDLKEAKKFIEAHDHEGSSISINIKCYEEEVYKVLNNLLDCK